MTEARRLLIGDLIHKHCVPTKSYMLSFVVIKKCFARVQLTERRGISRSHRLMVVVHAQCNSKENLPYCSLSLSFKFFQQQLEPQYTTQLRCIRRTVSPQLLFSFHTFNYFLTGMGRNQATKQPLNQIAPVQISRQHALKAQCPHIYTLQLENTFLIEHLFWH